MICFPVAAGALDLHGRLDPAIYRRAMLDRMAGSSPAMT